MFVVVKENYTTDHVYLLKYISKQRIHLINKLNLE